MSTDSQISERSSSFVTSFYPCGGGIIHLCGFSVYLRLPGKSFSHSHAGSRHETGICQCDHCDRSIPEKFQGRFARFPSSDYFECLYIWKSLQFAVQSGRQSVKSVYYDSYKKENLPGPGQCQCCRRYLPQPGTIYNRWSFGGFPGTDLLCPSSLFCRSYFWYFDWDPVQLCLESCPIIDYNRCQK